MLEPYPRSKVVKCPNCGEYGLIVERATDFTLYVLDCKNCGKVELNENEEMKARSAYRKDMKIILDTTLASTTLIRKMPK